jgi:hypothetical protein
MKMIYTKRATTRHASEQTTLPVLCSTIILINEARVIYIPGNT